MTSKEDRFAWIQRKVKEDAANKTSALMSELELMEDAARAYDKDIKTIRETIRYWKFRTITAEKKIAELESEKIILNEQLDEALGVVRSGKA